jgi:shikimate kinase
MGTGKTTVGRLLAARLDMEFVDTDALIEERHGAIPEIFETVGEAGFRVMERKVAAELGERTGLVIATGGRMVLDPENLRALSRNGHIFCLTASPDEIYRRLSSGIENRPLLSEDDPRGRIVELLAERQPDYLRFQQVDTDGMSASEIADQVAGMWRDRAL